MTVAQSRRIDCQCPFVSPWRRRDAFDPERARTKRRGPRQYRGRAPTLGLERDRWLAGVEGLEVVELGEMHGEASGVPGDQWRVLHVQLRLLRPARDIEG